MITRVTEAEFLVAIAIETQGVNVARFAIEKGINANLLGRYPDPGKAAANKLSVALKPVGW
jgi:hypothetical protein